MGQSTPTSMPSSGYSQGYNPNTGAQGAYPPSSQPYSVSSQGVTTNTGISQGYVNNAYSPGPPPKSPGTWRNERVLPSSGVYNSVKAQGTAPHQVTGHQGSRPGSLERTQPNGGNSLYNLHPSGSDQRLNHVGSAQSGVLGPPGVAKHNSGSLSNLQSQGNLPSQGTTGHDPGQPPPLPQRNVPQAGSTPRITTTNTWLMDTMRMYTCMAA